MVATVDKRVCLRERNRHPNPERQGIMAEKQIIGDQQALDRKVTNPPTHSGPTPNAQLVGDSLPLSRNPTRPPTHTHAMGEVQQIGDSVPLNRNAVPVWANERLPMSNLENEADTGKGKK